MKRSKISFCAMLVVVLLSMASCGHRRDNRAEQVPVVRIDTVVQAGVGSVLQFPGRVVAADEVNVSFRVAGPLRRVYAQEGKAVKAGQLLAEIDPTDYRVQLSATEAEYAQVKAEAERVMALYAENGTTASNYDKARYGLQQIEAKLQNHRNQLAYTRIYAPFSGVVQKCFFEGGETVAAGLPIVSILSSGKLEVEVNLPAVSYMHIDEFQSYSCTLDVLPGLQLPLQLISVLPKANTNQLYTLRLRLDPQGERVAPGMSAWVTIHTSADGASQMRVPTTAIAEDDGQSYVYLYESGTVRRVAVKVEMLHTDGTANVTGALSAGDRIVTSGVHHLSDGARVEPLQPVSDTNVGGML